MKLLLEVARLAPYNCTIFDYILAMINKLLKNVKNIETVINIYSLHCPSEGEGWEFSKGN